MEENIFLNDMIHNHAERMGVLRRYYPFFKLWESGFGLYRDGQYAELDMAYITMAVLRYFIEENSFNDRPVSYEMYAAFMKSLLVRDFELNETDEDMEALTGYIFDKLCNEGKPFTSRWFDPAQRQFRQLRIKLIDSRFENDHIVYTLTADAIAFYLDTKEIRDESPMNVEQVLLGKMVRSRDFKGGLEMVRRINQEVSRMVAQKEEIERLFSHNVFEGERALEDFLNHGMAWFEEEQKMFSTNRELVDQAIALADGSAMRREIAALDEELKRAMRRHSDLLSACTQLQVRADEAINAAKHNRFRRRTDFEQLRKILFETDDVQRLAPVLNPLFGLKTRKSLNLELLDNMLDDRPEIQDLKERIEKASERDYVYEDELADARIRGNFDYLLKVLFDQIIEKGCVRLDYLAHLYMMKFDNDIFYNGDLYSFLTHLSQKSEYDMTDIQTRQETFMEGQMAKFMSLDTSERYEGLAFKITFEPDVLISPVQDFEISSMTFERTDGHGQQKS